MTERILQHGDVVTVAFSEKIPQAREQEGYRPAIIVGIPERLGIPRFNLVIVVPITTDRGMPWAINSPKLYPSFPAGTAGLSSASIALLDQVRAVDVRELSSIAEPSLPISMPSLKMGCFNFCSLQKCANGYPHDGSRHCETGD